MPPNRLLHSHIIDTKVLKIKPLNYYFFSAKKSSAKNISKYSDKNGGGYLCDEVAHVGQDSPSCQVDFPVRRGDEFLVESQVLSSTLPSDAQLVQVTAMEREGTTGEVYQSQQVPLPYLLQLCLCSPSL